MTADARGPELPIRPRLLRRPQALQFLAGLTAGPGVIDGTAYLEPGTDHSHVDWLPPEARRSPAGLVLATGPGTRIAIAPPFPVPLDGVDAEYDGPVFGPLVMSLNARRTVALVLLRLGAYAVGVGSDAQLTISKTGTRYVKGRHRAGGQSQRRFERNRESWIKKLYDEVCRVAADRFREVDKEFDALALGGDRHVTRAFLKNCPYIGEMAGRLPTVRVAVDRPGLRALESAVDDLWSCRVWQVITAG